MPNYYLTVEKVGEGCNVDKEGRLEHWDLPDSYGFAFEKDAEKLQPGDKLVDYVAPAQWGFAAVVEVETWETALAYKYVPDIHSEYPWRVKVRVLCEIKGQHLMPKWAQLRPYLKWCRGMSASSANQTLRQPLRPIEKDDYELIAKAVCRAAKQ